MAEIAPLPEEALGWCCPDADLPFETTADLPEPDGIIGQERALEALRYALSSRRPGYNIYALGPEGIGKHTIVRHMLEAKAAKAPRPGDICYVADFRDARVPRLLRLPAGRGADLRGAMEKLLAELLPALRNAFENEEYRTRRQVIEEELKERQEQAASEVEEAARAKSIALVRAPMGFAFAPMADGKILNPEQFQQLPEPTRKQIAAEVETLQKQLRDALAKGPAWMKETRDQLKKLNDATASFAVGYLFDALRPAYADLPEVQEHLDAARRDIVEHVEAFLQIPEQAAGQPPLVVAGQPLFRRYRVNLLVDNADVPAAPVVYEDDPSFDRLIGRIEHRAEMGALVTDFLMIRGGSLHRANGGFLMLDAQKMLMRPFAYDGLKRALQAGLIRIESPLQAAGVLATATLEPEPVPLDVKLVHVGDRRIYYLLAEADPEFSRLFKIAADFDEHVPRDGAMVSRYARLLGRVAREEKLRPLDREGVGRALEHAVRRAGDAEKLTTDQEDLADLLREADYWADEAGRPVIGGAEILRAIESRTRRLDRIRELMQEQITQGTIAIATSGEAVGQINGLSVLQIGGFAFGRPSRITARIRMGGGQVIDIEREVKLGGPLHSKGVLILQGFLAATFALDAPLSLSASLVFEQSYGGVDGDSASSAELYCLLSAIGEVPIRQALAVTGSVSQKGEVQAIGGVNEKIEGFFDVCEAQGLAGSNGVLIPATNRRHLMLHERVRRAVAAGRFRIFAVRTIEEGIELLTGLPAGKRGADGTFPEGTVFRKVEDRLRTLALHRREFVRLNAKDGPAEGPAEGEDRS
jgi:predicted ATP-dependent protease